MAGAPAEPLCGLPGLGRGRLCAACIERHAPPLARCRRCALQVLAGRSTCGGCLAHPPPFLTAIAALDYAHPWDGLIAHFKFHGALEPAPAFAQLIRRAVERDPAPRPTLLLPMPLSRSRLRERGYNQAWELTRRLSGSLQCACDPKLLLRVRDTPHQSTLPPDRRVANVRAAFGVDRRRAERLVGRKVVLVDDVMTTGASAAEAARTLLRAGAVEVGVWVVARTPRPGEG